MTVVITTYKLKINDGTTNVDPHSGFEIFFTVYAIVVLF
jgi:hypothetical protein